MGRYYVKRGKTTIGGEHKHLQSALDAAASIVEYGGPVYVVDDSTEGERVVATFNKEGDGHVQKQGQGVDG